MRIIDRILLIRLSSIGDILLASPLIYLLNRKYPAAKIDFVIFKEYSDLIRNHPDINRIIEFDKVGGFGELYRIKKYVKSQKYDVILDIHSNFRSHWITAGNFQAVFRNPDFSGQEAEVCPFFSGKIQNKSLPVPLWPDNSGVGKIY